LLVEEHLVKALQDNNKRIDYGENKCFMYYKMKVQQV
jgi:hypothetical protein